LFRMSYNLAGEWRSNQTELWTNAIILALDQNQILNRSYGT
jgi:hypothetical protein